MWLAPFAWSQGSGESELWRTAGEHAQKASLNMWAREKTQSWVLVEPLGTKERLCQQAAYHILGSREYIQA